MYKGKMDMIENKESEVRLIDANALIRTACEKFYTTNYYNHILEMIDNAPTVETDWISVEEELPEISEHHVSDVVLCYCKGGVYAFSELEENIFGQKCFSCERDDEYHCNPLEVIAWMPLPKFNEKDEA